MADPIKYETNEPVAAVIEFLEKADENDLASKVLDVFARYSNNIEQLNLLAKLYLDIRDIPNAIKYANDVLALTTTPEQKYNARANLAKMYNNVNMPAESLSHSNINRMITPSDPDTLLELVFSLYLLNRKDDAETILRDLKAKEHTLSERHRNIVDFNLGTYNMEQGHFLKGLAGFLINIKKLELWFSSRELPYEYWSGGIYPGRTLILFMEGGGIGDEFITVRWMDDLKALGFNPIYYTGRPDIANIFNRCGYETVLNLDNVPTDSLWTYAMQVPLWLEVPPEKVLREYYLYPSAQARAQWKINSDEVIRIGIRWSGNKKNERDLHRQIPLASIMSMLHEVYDHLPEGKVEYYSLQVGDGIEELDDYPEIIDHTPCIHSYDDTLAFLETLTFVISSCTSVLHAAAIVGTKTYGLIPISAYFTWLSPPIGDRSKNTSIWYGDNLTLYRQVKIKSWDEPLYDLKVTLMSELDELI
jgi:hypothetical protein